MAMQFPSEILTAGPSLPTRVSTAELEIRVTREGGIKTILFPQVHIQKTKIVHEWFGIILVSEQRHQNKTKHEWIKTIFDR